MSKIQNIDHCWECKEHYDYGGNNLDRCGETGKLLSDIEVIPTWCPLPDKDGWLPIESKDLTVPGYYWWLPECSSGNAAEPSHWTIIAWHPQDTSVSRSGVFVGPIPSPPETTK
jgi:hypothetical protein